MPIYDALKHAVIFVLSNDAFMWYFFLYSHVGWMKGHPDLHRRKQVTPRALRITCVFSTLFTIALCVWWAYFNVLISHDRNWPHEFGTTPTFILTALGLLAFIHHFAIFARFYCMPRRFWPPLSRLVSKLLHKFFKTEPFPY